MPARAAITFALALLTAACASSSTQRGVVQAMTSVADWQLANPSTHPTTAWQQAPFWIGLTALAPISSDPHRYRDAVRRNGEANAWRPGPKPFLADDHAITQSYFALYETECSHVIPSAAEREESGRGLASHHPDSSPSSRLGMTCRRMIEPSLSRFDEMLRNPFDEPLTYSWEKTDREWVWCDALFMSPPALAMAARATGERRYLDLMNRLWWKTTDYLYDKDEHLYYRDDRFLGKKIFWSRGNGWVLAGLARVLQNMPSDYPHRPRFVALFREMAAKVVTLQSGDGYWRSNLLDPAATPDPESSGTGFFTYALAWGVNAGLLDRDRYEPTIRRGWSALVRAVHPDGKIGYVQEIGIEPGPSGRDSTEIYGAGAFLLAGGEVYQLED